MTLNVDLLKRTLAHIEAHPETWRQTTYRCRTGMCFAGWAAELDGGQWAAGPSDFNGEELIAREGDPGGAVHAGTIRAQHRARHVLGLDNAQASDLFDADNTLDDLRRIVAELCGEATS